MAFRIDVCIGRLVEAEVCRQLPDADIRCVREVDPRMPDDEIVRLAKHERRVIVTSDKDFGELVYREGLSHEGILLLRADELPVVEKAVAIVKVIRQHGELLPGHFCVYQNGMLRIR